MCHGVCASDVMASVRQMSCHVMLKLLLCRGLVTLTVSASQQSSLEITSSDMKGLIFLML